MTQHKTGEAMDFIV